MKGCVPQFEKWLQDNLTLVAGIFIGVALLQVLWLSEPKGSGPGPSSNVGSSLLSSADFWDLSGAELSERHRGRAGELVRT